MSTKQSAREIVRRANEAALDRIEAASDKLEEARRKYLKDRGWVYTCKTPGSLWLWTKRIEVKRNYRHAAYLPGTNKPNPLFGHWYYEVTSYDALTGMETAIHMQRNLDLDE